MRNGNILLVVQLPKHKSSSYRTYEEWKHIKRTQKLLPSYCSYRTYEEWKLVSLL